MKVRRTAWQEAMTGLCLSLAMTSTTGRACPAYIQADTLPGGTKPLLRTPRTAMKLFALRADGAWERLPLQIDSLDEAHVLKREEEAAGEALQDQDRIVLRTENFGAAYAGQTKLPCNAAHLYEIERPGPEKKYAYLAPCKDLASLEPLASQVNHDNSTQIIRSPIYTYNYLPNNQLIFRSLRAQDITTGKMYEPAKDADVLLHLNLRKFFTLEFDNDDVQSYVEASKTGEVGFVARIQFYLSILFFKIDLKLATMASYFSDAAHLPMVVDVPLDAPKRTHPGSGMTFLWKKANGKFTPAKGKDALPAADAELIKRGPKTLAQQGLPHCQGAMCLFRLRGKFASQDFTIDMQVARDLVRHGFYPQWVESLPSFKESLGWDAHDGDEATDLAVVYFETSGLPKGRYNMDYWIRLGSDGGHACPAPVNVTRIVDPKTVDARTAH